MRNNKISDKKGQTQSKQKIRDENTGILKAQTLPEKRGKKEITRKGKGSEGEASTISGGNRMQGQIGQVEIRCREDHPSGKKETGGTSLKTTERGRIKKSMKKTPMGKGGGSVWESLSLSGP